MAREVWITGLGLVSSLGEGAKAHLGLFDGDADPVIDSDRFAPFSVHPAVPLELDRQIPKKADQRQMEPWQRLGVYAAGLALEEAGLKGDAERLAAMQLIVAAGGGERDYAVDGQILTGLRTAEKPGVYLNERLMSDIRPTLFLAQLSNLLAGNISIVHGVTGATRTFMGEEQSGVDALRIAHARIAAGQGDTFLVGGAYNAERPDVLLIYEMGQLLWKKPYASVWDRPGEGGGFIPGSAAGFLVLEARETAEARGATPVAILQAVAADQVTRGIGAVGASVESLWQQAASEFRPAGGAILSGATGITGITEEERGALAKLMPGTSVHAMGDFIGHTIEAQFPLSVAIAAAAIRDSYLRQAVVTSIGHMRGEGLAFLTSV